MLLCTLSGFAQKNPTYKISYQLLVNKDMVSSEDSTDESLAIAILLAFAEKDKDKPIAEVWTNTDYVKARTSLQTGSYEIMDKKNGISSLVYPETEEYFTTTQYQDKFIDLGNDIIGASELPIEFTQQEKVIAGYSCKLAIINVDTEEESTTLHIWYSPELPTTYWGEYYYLKNIPGGALEISTSGVGIVANDITIVKDKNIFDIPKNYTLIEAPVSEPYYTDEEYDYDYSEDELEYELAEDRIAFLDKEIGLYGIKKNDGNIIVEPKYAEIFGYSNGLAIVTDENYFSGAIDLHGKTVIPVQYEKLSYNDQDGTYLFATNGKYGVMNAKHQILIPSEYDYLTFFENGYAIATKNDLSGIIDRKNNIIVPLKYISISEIVGDKFISLGEDDKFHLQTFKGDIIASYELIGNALEANLFLVMENSRYGYINGQGKVVIPLQYEYASGFYEGLASVLELGKTDPVLINTKGQVVKE